MMMLAMVAAVAKGAVMPGTFGRSINSGIRSRIHRGFLRGGATKVNSRLAFDYIGAPLSKKSFEPVTIEAFVDFFCPFCVKAAPTILKLAEKEGLAVRAVIYPQPWHWEGGILGICFNVILKNDPKAAPKYFKLLFENYENFKAEGKKGDVETIKKMAYTIAKEVTDMDEETFMKEYDDQDSPGVNRMLKNQIKYGRSNGIHETPTYTINGLIHGSAGSAWSVEDWEKELSPLMTAHKV
mmetsp:Transcript_21551/g.32071  ORF Transcript_21551/g.32071 Transcript_21551/m.32071 type:complete len:239 (-) Transcript_21551:82-798(-)